MGTMGIGRRTLSLTAAALAAFAPGSLLTAQQAEPPAPAQTAADALAGILEALRSDSFDQREEALTRLAEQPHITDDEIIAVIRTQDLTSEQRTRLTEALRLRFNQRPRAGLGVSMQAGAGGVGVQAIVPGFPAGRVLQGGDVITSLGGVDLRRDPTPDSLRFAILSYDPGEKIHVDVIRAGAPLTLRAELGRYEDLGAAQPIGDDDLAMAWSIRAQRLDIEACPGEALECALPQGEWVRRLNRDPRRPDAGEMFAGGQPMSEASSMSQRAAGRVAMAQAVGRAAADEKRGDFGQAIGGDIAEALAAMDASIRADEAKLANADLTERERTELEADIRQRKRTLNALRAGALRLQPEDR